MTKTPAVDQKSSPQKATIKHIAEVPWREFPRHFGGALSKPLVHPETNASAKIDYRISSYAPMAYVPPHSHKVQEQVYHVLEGEGVMEIDGKRQLVRAHDVVFIPPGIEHAIYNEGLRNLVFIVATAPIEDE